nr:hypothetical protein [Tanacetum cinerariifolium]
MEPNTSLGHICMREQHGVSLNDKVKSEGHWDGSEFQDTTNSGEKKIAKSFTFYKMEMVENEKNMISNEVSVKLLLNYEEKNGEKIVKKDFLVALNGELYFVKFIINLKQYDVKPSVVFGRSFLRLTKGIVDFRNERTYSDEGPSLTVKQPLTQEEMSCEAIEKDIYDRILILQEPRLIIETLKFSDQHKKLLDSVLLDKLKLDGEVKIDKEEATEEIIRGYKMISEKNDPGVFVLPIRIEAKFDTHALADTSSNINVIPYLRNKHEESDDDEEEYCVKRDKNGKPIYGLKFAKYLNCDDPMDRGLALQEALNPFRKIYTSGTNAFEAGSSFRPKRTRQHEIVEEAMLPRIYSSVIVKWEVLNNMDCAEEIEEMLEIKLYEMGGDEEIFTSKAWRRAFDIREPVYAELCHEFYATYEFDETVTDEDLMSSNEIQDEGFETYFRGRLRNDDHFNVNQYWSKTSSENGLIISMMIPKHMCVWPVFFSEFVVLGWFTYKFIRYEINPEHFGYHGPREGVPFRLGCS